MSDTHSFAVSIKKRGYQPRFLYFLFAEYPYSLHHDSTFKPFLFELAGELVCSTDIAHVLIIIGITAAAAIEFCPALAAFRL